MKNSAKRSFLALVAVFITPALIAWVLLETGWWMHFGSRHHGALLSNPVSLQQLMPAPSWQLLYSASEHCPDYCRQSLMQIRQIHKALGAEQHRVQKLILHSAPLDEDFQQLIKTAFPRTRLVQASHEDLTQLSDQFIFIVDPLGQVILRYPVQSTKEDAITSGKQILKDLKHLLKVSRIG